MRRIRFSDEAGHTRIGKLTDETIESGKYTYDIEAVNVLPPTDATKLLGIGGNNPSFIEQSNKYNWPEEFFDHPMYMKSANCFIGHQDTAILPTGGNIVFELEFAVIVGRQCRDVSAENAMSVVEGFTCYNDITDRSANEWLEIKAFDNTAPVGPVVASPDEVPEDAKMELRVNGEVKQHGRRSDYIDGVTEVVTNFSKHRTLNKGDILSLGTTSGNLGNLNDGDTVELEIEGIGTLRHDVVFV